MTGHRNHLGQPVGFPVTEWRAPEFPSGATLDGRYCHLERLNAERHGQQLHTANRRDTEHRIWTYLPYGPFETVNEYCNWINSTCTSNDPLFYAVIDNRVEQAIGVASYLRINPAPGVIEVGHINFSPSLQRTVMSTESMFLMMRHVFEDLGYRRYEWKCDALNAGSRNAALRLGFTFEGVFRQALIYKQRNRDTAWYSIIDTEWPAIKSAFQNWLDPANFSEDRQLRRLSDFM